MDLTQQHTYTQSDIEELREALFTIPINSVDSDYNTWLKLLIGFKDGGGSYEDFDTWSGGGAHYDAQGNRRTWDAIKGKAGRKVTKATVYSYAIRNGWRSTRRAESKAPMVTRPADQRKEESFKVNLNVKKIDFTLTDEESKEDTIKYLNALFDPLDYVAIISKATQHGEKWNPLPDKLERHTTCEALTGYNYIEAVFDDYNKYNDSHGQSGIWCRINPMKGQGGSDDDVEEYRYCLIECDKLSIQRQIDLIYALRLPVATLTYSGNKSVHAVVKVNAVSKKQYEERRDYIYKACLDNGLEIDTSCKNASRMTRLAGVMRGTQCQTLLATDIGEDNYLNWYLWFKDRLKEKAKEEAVTEAQLETLEEQPADQVTEEDETKTYEMFDYTANGGHKKSIDYFASYKSRKTGFENLDEDLTLYPGLMAIGGGASVGKTTFAINLVDNLLEQGETVLYFALEQEPVELSTKLIAKNLREKWPGDALSNKRIKDGETNDKLEELLQNWPVKYKRFKVVRCNFSFTSDGIKKYVENYIRNNGVKPVVVIDYLQLLSTPNTVRGDTRALLDYNIKQLKTLQVENELLVIMISNLNRSSYQDPISYDSFKESGLIEFTCDYMLGLQLAVLSSPEYKEAGGDKRKADRQALLKNAQEQNPKLVQLVVLKNRNGKQRLSAYFKYNMAFDLFIPTINPYNN